MALQCLGVEGYPQGDDEGAQIIARLAEPLWNGCNTCSIEMVPDDPDPRRCFIDEGAYIDQSYCSWGRFHGFELSPDRLTLLLTMEEDRSIGVQVWQLDLLHPLDDESEQVLRVMAGQADAQP
jgi:hypothetical protein